MEGFLTLAGPRLDWGTMVGMLRLVWLCAFRFRGKAAFGALGLVPFPVTLQDAVVLTTLARRSSTSAWRLTSADGPLWEVPSWGVLCWASRLPSVGMAECGVKKRRRGRIGEGASWAGREKWVLSVRFPQTAPNC
ncbi:unnamed protein product [Prunus armeniaca]